MPATQLTEAELIEMAVNDSLPPEYGYREEEYQGGSTRPDDAGETLAVTPWFVNRHGIEIRGSLVVRQELGEAGREDVVGRRLVGDGAAFKRDHRGPPPGRCGSGIYTPLSHWCRSGPRTV